MNKFDISVSFTSPSSGTNLLGERRHLFEYGVDVGHYVFAIDQNRRVGFVSQRNMQNSTFFVEQ